MRLIGASLLMAGLLAVAPTGARASSSDPTSSAYTSNIAGAGDGLAHLASANGLCSLGQTVLNALNPFSHCQPLRQAAGTAVHAVASVPGTVAGYVATGIMDQVTAWMVRAAQTISGWVVKEAGVVTHPELEASWYLRLFSRLAALAGALAALVGLIALGSAVIRRDPDALGEVLYGVARAGIGTSIVIALTVIALGAADAIANDFARQMPADFFRTLADQWGGSGWGGFGAAGLAFLVAFVATIAGLLVWLELIVREAAIYIAVLFFPVALAASIWPALRSWVRRLSMLLLMFVLLRPVVVIVLALAGSVTSSGLSLGSGSIPHSVGTILAGVAIFALAAFTPWALMFLLGAEIGAMQSRAGASAGGAVRGSSGRDGVGGGLARGSVLAGGGEPAIAGGGAAGAGANGGGGGVRLSSLGGSGSGAAASGGSIAAAAGWVGGAASAAGRIGGQLGQHAAARVHVAAGRGGVAPGGVPAPWTAGPDRSNGAAHARAADPEAGERSSRPRNRSWEAEPAWAATPSPPERPPPVDAAAPSDAAPPPSAGAAPRTPPPPPLEGPEGNAPGPSSESDPPDESPGSER